MKKNEVIKHTTKECLLALFTWIALLFIFIAIYLNAIPITAGFLLTFLVVLSNIVSTIDKKEYLLDFISTLTTSAIFCGFIYLSSYGLTRLVMDSISI